MSDTGTIKLVRKFSTFVLKKADILIDGNKIGGIENGQQQNLAIDAGQHTIQVKGGGCSEVLNIEISPGSSVQLECGVTNRNRVWTLAVVALLGFVFIDEKFIKNWTLLIFGATLFILTALWQITGIFRTGAIYYLKRVD
jgi:hypothetical protein